MVKILYDLVKILLLYNGEISQCVSEFLPKFEPNRNGHNSANFEAMTSRFCMAVDLEEEMTTMPRRRTSTKTTTTTGTTTMTRVSQLWDWIET